MTMSGEGSAHENEKITCMGRVASQPESMMAIFSSSDCLEEVEVVCCLASCFVSRQLASVHWLLEVMRDIHLLTVFYSHTALAFSG